MFQSSVLLNFDRGGLEVTVELPPSRLEKAYGRTINPQDLPTIAPQLQVYVQSRMHATSENREWAITQAQPLRWELIDGAPYVVATFHLQVPDGGDPRAFVFTDDVILDTLSSHVALVSVRSDWNTSTFANDPELLGVLTGEQRSIAVNRTSGGWTKGFSSVFGLGTRHIAEGTDHLLFLLALLLPAPLVQQGRKWGTFAGVKHGFLAILKIVTAFTLGHSLTLALAASGLVHVPAGPIEVLIAISILVSAMHAMRPLFPGKEAFIAAGFGLIHGLAFASTLADLGLRGWEKLFSIFAFNLGIEVMQLLVVVCVMPSLMLLSRTAVYTTLRIVGACFAGAAAAGWVIERSLHVDLHVDGIVDALAKHSVLFAVLLLAFALGSYVHTQMRPLMSRAL